jgi:hypothetical protein
MRADVPQDQWKTAAALNVGMVSRFMIGSSRFKMPPSASSAEIERPETPSGVSPSGRAMTAQPVQASDCAGMDTVHHGYLKNSSS